VGTENGLRVFDRGKDWREVFRDDQYKGDSFSAAFARDGRLATTAWDGKIRLYEFDPNSDSPNFRRAGEPIPAPSGHRPYGAAFSLDGKRLAIGYYDAAAIDVLDGTTLSRLGGQRPADASPGALDEVGWSSDGRTLFAAGTGVRARDLLLFAWDQGGLGDERRMTYCASNTAAGVDALPDGRILVGSMADCLGLMNGQGEPIWTIASPVLDLSWQSDEMRVSEDGKVIDFGYGDPGTAVLRFDLTSLTLSSPPPNDGLTFAPDREGLTINGWRNGTNPTVGGRAIALDSYEIARSLAIAPDAKRFFLGSSYALAAFDDTGAQKWLWNSRNEIWAVNASRDGRIVVSADGDGAIRWHRADDGRELLALQVLPNKESDPTKWDWVLWTPEGFYEATPGAQDVL
jgi:WD40 repeat protein